jgi:hypothetical protein
VHNISAINFQLPTLPIRTPLIFGLALTVGFANMNYPPIMKSILLLFISAALLTSCSKQSQENVQKAGDAVGQGSAIFFHALVDGVDKVLQCPIDIDPVLVAKGIALGNDKVSSFSTVGRNVLTLYIIFNKDFNDKILVKVYDSDGHEYGRASQTISAKQGDAKYIDFTFDDHAVLTAKSRFEME